MECRTEIASPSAGIGGSSAATGSVAGAGPVRFAAATPSAAEGALSATSTQGPQWEGETGITIVAVA